MSFAERVLLKKVNFRRNTTLKLFLCIFLIFVLFINILNFNHDDATHVQLINEQDQVPGNIKNLTSNHTQIPPQSALGISDFQDPFTRNFSSIQDFFLTKYQTNITLPLILYYREGDPSGSILTNITYSEDNLLLYNSLLKNELTDNELLQVLQDFNSTSFWHEGNRSNFEYGYIRSLNGTTGEKIDTNRYLVDNLMPVFLILENFENLTINNNTPLRIINTTFNLVNSSQFWNEQEGLFRFYNFSTDYRTDCNLQAVLAMLLINRSAEIDVQIRNRAFYLANLTMFTLINNRWNDTVLGFDMNSTDHAKYLNVNALGIMAMLEMWKLNGTVNSPYYVNATLLYNKLNQSLWSPQHGAYNYSASEDWRVVSDLIDLESNALMMMACLKFFSLTGNITYYNRALELYNTFETSFYDTTSNAYNYSIGTLSNGNKNFNSNLKLCEAYMKALEIYNSSKIYAEYNVSDDIPEFIFEQDILNMTTRYVYESYLLSTYNITNANITYLFKFPNGTLIQSQTAFLSEGDDSHEITFRINETLPIANNYYINIIANTTYFAPASITKYFNVSSGIYHVSTEEIDNLNELYQGQIFDIEFTIKSIRNENLTLIASIEEGVVRNQSKNMYINKSASNVVPFEIEINPNANLGNSTFNINFKKDGVLYLTLRVNITIILALKYSEFSYSKNAYPGGTIDVSMKVFNYLARNPQEFNVSFSGEGIKDISIEEVLAPDDNEIFYYELSVKETTEVESTEIEMSISKGDEIFFTKQFSVTILPKLSLIRDSFPSQVPQGETAWLILIIQNNQKEPENFSLYINGEQVETNLIKLYPGENRIVKEITPSLNPYAFSTKEYNVEIKDSQGNTFVKLYYEVQIILSPVNLLIFYLLPMIVPVGIVLFYKNKEIKSYILKKS